MPGLPVGAVIFVRIAKSEQHPPVPFIHKIIWIGMRGDRQWDFGPRYSLPSP